MSQQPTASPLLDLIRERGLLDDLQLEEVREEQSRTGKPVREVLADLGMMDLASQLELMANHMGTEVVQLDGRDFTPAILSSVPADAARMYKCFPVALHDGVVQLALADPLNPTLLDELGYVIRKEIAPVVADPAEIDKVFG
jgi:hypothetical protein